MDPTEFRTDCDPTPEEAERELDEIDREVERTLRLIHRLREERERREAPEKDGESVRRISLVEAG